MRRKKVENQENLDYHVHSALLSLRRSPCSFPEHWHLSAEFILAMKDDCHYIIGKDEYVLREGDVLLIWPMELHSVVSTPEEASLILQFDDALITGSNDLSLSLPMIQDIHLISQTEEPELNHQIAALMKDSLRIYDDKDFFLDTKIKINIYHILLSLCSYGMQKKTPSGSDGASSQLTLRKIRNACSYIAKNCGRDLTQQEVADYAGFSYYYFSRIFKEYTASTFSEYLARQRINRAIQLLGSDMESITEIAYRAGFQSISSFNRVFKTYMNCSPREYRDNYRSPVEHRNARHASEDRPL